MTENFGGLNVISPAVHDEMQPKYTVLCQIIIVASVLILIIVIITGNLTMLLSLFKFKKMRTIHNLLLCSLAVSDLLLATFVLPLKLAQEILGYWPLTAFLCKIYLAHDILLCTASIWNICLISINRYLAVTKGVRYRQYKAKKRAAFMITMAWFVSASVCAPGFALSVYQIAITEETMACLHSDKVWYILFSASGSFYIPMSILFVTYGSMSFILHRNAKQSMIRDAVMKRQRKLHLTTGLLLAAFLICWSPFFLTYVVYALCPTCCISQDILKITEWIGYLNSAVNPFLYSLSQTDIRKAFNYMLRTRFQTAMHTREKSKHRQAPMRPARALGEHKPDVPGNGNDNDAGWEMKEDSSVFSIGDVIYNLKNRAVYSDIQPTREKSNENSKTQTSKIDERRKLRRRSTSDAIHNFFKKEGKSKVKLLRQQEIVCHVSEDDDASLVTAENAKIANADSKV